MRDHHRHPVGQLTARQLDLYGNQLTRCLKALGTMHPSAPMSSMNWPPSAPSKTTAPGRPPMRDHDVTALTGRELEQARRELAARLALARPGSPARMPILAQMKAIDAELADRSGARPGGLPSSTITGPREPLLTRQGSRSRTGDLPDRSVPQ